MAKRIIKSAEENQNDELSTAKSKQDLYHQGSSFWL